MTSEQQRAAEKQVRLALMVRDRALGRLRSAQDDAEKALLMLGRALERRDMLRNAEHEKEET